MKKFWFRGILTSLKKLHTHTHTHTHTHVRTYIYIYIHKYIHASMQIRIVELLSYVSAVSWLRRLVASLPPWTPGLAPRSVHVGSVVDKVALGQVSLRFLRFSRQYHSTAALHTHISSGVWTIGTFVAAVQRHRLTPSTWKATGWTTGVRFQNMFLFFTTYRPALWSTQTPIKWVKPYFLWGKAAETWSWHTSPCSVKVKNQWRNTSTLTYVCMTLCFVKHHG
jgi:hypothetical protein